MFWNCQGIRSKHKELELYLKENNFDIVTLNETFLTKNVDFKIQGYDTIKNDRSTGTRGGVAFLVKHGLVINKEYRNIDFNIITDNEALVIDIDLCNNQNLILATIYCPNGNPNFRLFETINNLSDNVMFVGDFNSKLEAFGCAKKNSSGPMLKNIQSHLNLTYLNNDEHTHLDRAKGSTDILDMAFISPNLTKHDIQFLIGDDLGSDHLPIEISIDAQPHRNTHTNPIRYKFDQTDREVFKSTLEAALSSGDIPKLKSTQDIGDDFGSDHLPIEISIDARPHRNTHTNPIRYKFDQTDREVFKSTLEAALSSGDIPKLKSTQDIGDDFGSDHLPIEISIDAQPHRNTHTNPIRYKFDQTDREVFKSTLEAALSSGDIPKLKSTQDIGDDFGSDHLPIEISIDAQPHRNTHTNPIRYKFDQTDREVFKSPLEAALSSGDILELKSTQDIDKYADFIVTAISTAVDKAIPTYKSGRPESQPVSDETLALIKEKRRLRWQYSQAHDPLVKTRINQLQKEIRITLG